MSTTINNLPTGPLSLIMGYLSFDDQVENTKNVEAKRGESSFFQARLVCKKWHKASQLCRGMWVKFLIEHGPKKIGPNAVHKNTHRYWNRPCKMKDGRCTTAQHYELKDVKYGDNQMDVYREVMRTMGRKQIQRCRGIAKRAEKSIVAKRDQTRYLGSYQRPIQLCAGMNRKMRKVAGAITRNNKRVERTRKVINELSYKKRKAQEYIDANAPYLKTFAKKRGGKRRKKMGEL
jgi:hypothetical protein